MTIDWDALGKVFGVSVGVTAGLVGLFTLGVVALARRGATSGGGATAALARTGAYVCFAMCAAVIAYGFYLIVA
jgi:hypothetical protein